jgi:hypothetical protein
MNIPNWARVLLIMICFGVSVIGFMIKLPSTFRHVDKEMHTLFYFGAAAFLNVLFNNKNLIRHIVIFVVLYLFSMGIEYAQEYSNTFLRKRIHGRYDVEDIRANLKGLVLFSMVWIVIVSIWFAYQKMKYSKTETSGK